VEVPVLLRVLEDEVTVEYWMFRLLDDGKSDPAVGLAGDRLAVARADELDFGSAAEDHVAGVRLEAWDCAPAAVGGSWGGPVELTVSLGSGTVRLWAVTMGPSEKGFTVGGGGVYRVRVYCQGREQVWRIVEDPELDDFPEGVERYLVQFWPCE
jgi:hypothetical protein